MAFDNCANQVNACWLCILNPQGGDFHRNSVEGFRRDFVFILVFDSD